MTIIALVLAKGLKFNAVVLMGLIVCLYGVAVIQMGLSLDIATLLRNAASNPVSYLLATVGAVIWVVYCVIIKKMSGGYNLIALYFVLTALMMWLKYILFDRSVPDEISLMSILYVLAAGAAIGLGYGAWNFGILKGNATAMVVASYFTPVLSSVIVAILLGVSLVVVLAGCGIGVRRLVGLLSGDQQLNKPQKIITHAIK
ncbi:EamA family transporter [Moraxella ovis]|uniref:EamA family transporter n=1 Tax=Moraxella ovis TaxID=29433 RepID=UPI0011BF8145|nr:EamA family transporter [Moraxella ovis]